METEQDLRTKLEDIKKRHAAACLKYYHKRFSEDEEYKQYLREKAKERYYKKLENDAEFREKIRERNRAYYQQKKILKNNI